MKLQEGLETDATVMEVLYVVHPAFFFNILPYMTLNIYLITHHHDKSMEIMTRKLTTYYRCCCGRKSKASIYSGSQS